MSTAAAGCRALPWPAPERQAGGWREGARDEAGRQLGRCRTRSWRIGLSAAVGVRRAGTPLYRLALSLRDGGRRPRPRPWGGSNIRISATTRRPFDLRCVFPLRGGRRAAAHGRRAQAHTHPQCARPPSQLPAPIIHGPAARVAGAVVSQQQPVPQTAAQQQQMWCGCIPSPCATQGHVFVVPEEEPRSTRSSRLLAVRCAKNNKPDAIGSAGFRLVGSRRRRRAAR
jgi:hypothetical protein